MLHYTFHVAFDGYPLSIIKKNDVIFYRSQRIKLKSIDMILNRKYGKSFLMTILIWVQRCDGRRRYRIWCDLFVLLTLLYSCVSRPTNKHKTCTHHPYTLKDILSPEQAYEGLYGQGPASVHSSHGGRAFQQGM